MNNNQKGVGKNGHDLLQYDPSLCSEESGKITENFSQYD
jgi:hypothetical protein